MFEGLHVVNLTPHPVRVLDNNGNVIAEWESSGSLRITYTYGEATYPHPLVRTANVSGVEGLELTKEADVVIVSRAMAMLPGLAPKGALVVYPDAEVRNPENPREVVGCRYLSVFTDPVFNESVEEFAKDTFECGQMNYGYPANACQSFVSLLDYNRKEA